MTKQEREEKLIDLKARQLMKQRQLDELTPETSTEEAINVIVEDRLASSSEIPLPPSLHLQVLQELLLSNTFHLNKSFITSHQK